MLATSAKRHFKKKIQRFSVRKWKKEWEGNVLKNQFGFGMKMCIKWYKYGYLRKIRDWEIE